VPCWRLRVYQDIKDIQDIKDMKDMKDIQDMKDMKRDAPKRDGQRDAAKRCSKQIRRRDRHDLFGPGTPGQLGTGAVLQR